MKKISCLFTMICVLVLISADTMALSISLDPQNLDTGLGDTITLNLNISELKTNGPDLLGAFSLKVNYDSSILNFDSIIFGQYLGDLGLLEADAYVDYSLAGEISLDEVSWLFDFELESLQSDNFTLASLQFTSVNLGTSFIELDNIVLSDAYGYNLAISEIQNAQVDVKTAPVPEPTSLFLFGTGLFCLANLKRKNTKKGNKK